MKFITRIASMMLIALISQHSLMGLPVTSTVMDDQCLEGFEKINGLCKPINSKLSDKKMESSTIVNDMNMKPTRSFNDIKMESSTNLDDIKMKSSTTLDDIKMESSTNLDDIKMKSSTILNSMKMESSTNLDGIKMESSTILNSMKMESSTIFNDINMESSSFPSNNTIIKEKPIMESTTAKLSTCPEGMESNQAGICQPVKLISTSEMNVLSTTELNESVGGVENPVGCPKGMKQDEDGACQETKPSKVQKTVIDPKDLLQKDGTCPENYKMVEGRCLYVIDRTNSTESQNSLPSSDNVSGAMRRKSGTDENANAEVVPVLPDNSCPKGTEYFDNGLCRKHDDSAISTRPCPHNYILIDGKCIYKRNRMSGLSESSTTIMSESTTLVEKPFLNDEFDKSTTESQFNRRVAGVALV